MRQAAGPLTENLPNVLTGGPQRVGLSLDTHPLEEQRVVSHRASYARAPGCRCFYTGRDCLPRDRRPEEATLLKLRKVEIVGFKSF